MNSNVLTLSDVIVAAMPFSDSLVAWSKEHPDFQEGLKISNPDNFITLGLTMLSSTSNVPEDEIIGFLAYDTDREIFKQDFIVNVGGNHEKFVLYSKLPNKKYTPHVQHVKQFFVKYGNNGHYVTTHHLTLDDMDALGKPEVSERARQAVQLAERIKKSGRRKLEQSDLVDTMQKIEEAKRERNQHIFL